MLRRVIGAGGRINWYATEGDCAVVGNGWQAEGSHFYVAETGWRAVDGGFAGCGKALTQWDTVLGTSSPANIHLRQEA